ncbi:MAG: Sec-independent protein translocase protein TatB [Burkholderiales bacterium]|jgi:sec-independent protein translocase protein TatB|nr:Sec-independent protein translocase protein TatB [Burkholderiales bacterium]
MFDFSFSELLVVAVVAMIVIGPKRLPKTVRTLGLLLGRAQRYVSSIKADIQREMELEELQKVRESVQGISRDIKQSIQSVAQETEKAAKQTEVGAREKGEELNRIAEDKAAVDNPTDNTTDKLAAQSEKTPVENAPLKAPDHAVSAASVMAATGIKAEPQITVPAFLQGEVELSIPEASSVSSQKPEAR